jgi:hypothetical protein
VEAAPAGLQSGEECSGVLLAPRWSNLLCEKPFFPHVVISDEIAPPREILLLEESWAKAHMDWRHLKKKFFMKTILKSKINSIRKKLNLNLNYTIKLPAGAGFLNLVRLSL